MNANNAVVQFEGVNVEIIDADGKKWVTMRDLAKALGYLEPTKLGQVMDRNADEFNGKVMVLKMSTIKGERNHRVINYHGVIRAAMLSRTPKAKAFRDWAEDVLFSVMTTGSYTHPNVPSVFDPEMKDVLNTVMNMIQHVVNRQDHIEKFIVDKMTHSEPDVTHWPTPAQRLRQLMAPNKPFHRFNTGSSFDLMVNDYHYTETGSYLRLRSRQMFGKRAEFVVPECPDIDALLRKVYPIYEKKMMELHQRPKQTELNLVMFLGRQKNDDKKEP